MRRQGIELNFTPALQLRAVEIDGEPWFLAGDVTEAIGLKTNNLRRGLEADEIKPFKLSGLRGRAPLVVSESGLYSLIMRSTKPEAKTFRRWVTSEVLPAIRRNGGYMTPEVAQTAIDDPAVFMAKALVIANAKHAPFTPRLSSEVAQSEDDPIASHGALARPPPLGSPNE